MKEGFKKKKQFMNYFIFSPYVRIVTYLEFLLLFEPEVSEDFFLTSSLQ